MLETHATALNELELLLSCPSLLCVLSNNSSLRCAMRKSFWCNYRTHLLCFLPSTSASHTLPSLQHTHSHTHPTHTPFSPTRTHSHIQPPSTPPFLPRPPPSTPSPRAHSHACLLPCTVSPLGVQGHPLQEGSHMQGKMHIVQLDTLIRELSVRTSHYYMCH